jgi:hypothetical protein
LAQDSVGEVMMWRKVFVYRYGNNQIRFNLKIFFHVTIALLDNLIIRNLSINILNSRLWEQKWMVSAVLRRILNYKSYTETNNMKIWSVWECKSFEIVISCIILKWSPGISQYILGTTADNLVRIAETPGEFRTGLLPDTDPDFACAWICSVPRTRRYKTSGRIFRKRVERVADGSGSCPVRALLLALFNLRALLKINIFASLLLT